MRIERIVSTVRAMSNTTLPPTEWSDVVTAVIHHDRDEGTKQLLIYNADETLAHSRWLNAVGERAAMLEATADMQREGYKPVRRTWEGEPEGESEPVRTFRRASAKGAKS